MQGISLYFLHFLYRYIQAYKSYVLVSFFFFCVCCTIGRILRGQFLEQFPESVKDVLSVNVQGEVSL